MADLDLGLIPSQVRTVFSRSYEAAMSEVRYLADRDIIDVPDSETMQMIEVFVTLSLLLQLIIGPLEGMNSFHRHLGEFDVTAVRIGNSTFDQLTASKNTAVVRAFNAMCAKAGIRRRLLLAEDVETLAKLAIAHRWPEGDDAEEQQ